MTSSKLRIAIVGAGPGGLTLGSLLHKAGLPFTLFELRPKPTEDDFEKPSGSLDLHEGSGLTAIKELGLFEKFSASTSDCSQVMKIANKNGDIVWADKEDHQMDGHVARNRPEISRNKLNQILLSKVPADSIRWQHKLFSARRSPSSGEIELDFGPNGVKTYDLTIGADGAWSKVRSLLTTSKPVYAGQQNITATLRNVTSKHPRIADLVGSGTFMALADQHAIITQRGAKDTLRLYTMIKIPDSAFAETHELHRKTATQTKSVVLDGEAAPFRNFSPVLRDLISTAFDSETTAEPESSVDIRPMFTFHTNIDAMKWESTPVATLLGDAAHVMPPNGEGVNTAMQDALELSKRIMEAHDGAFGGEIRVREALAPLIKGYEEDMFERAKEVAKETEQLLELMYGSDDGSREMTKFFEQVMQGPQD